MGVWVGLALFAVAAGVLLVSWMVAFVSAWVVVREVIRRGGVGLLWTGLRLASRWRLREVRRNVVLRTRLVVIDVRRRWGFLRAAGVLLRVSAPVWVARYRPRVRVSAWSAGGSRNVAATWRGHRVALAWYRVGVVSAMLVTRRGRVHGFVQVVPAVRV